MPEISPALYRAGTGEPLLLLHGFTGTWHHWKPILGELVPRYEVIAPTLAGHDGGPPFDKTGNLQLSDATDSLEEHLDELGVTTAHVVGNSMGGALAIELGKRGRARSIVAIAPGGGWAIGSGEGERLARFFVRQMKVARATQARLPQITRRPGTRRIALRDVMRHGELVPPPDAIHMVRSSLRCSTFTQVVDALHADTVTVDALETVSAPTLLAWPEFDRILPVALHSERFRTQIPGAEFRILPGCGHVPMWDATQLVADTITEFVGRHAPVAVA